MRGSRISETILKKAGVPAKEKTMVETAAKASGSVGSAKRTKSDFHGPTVSGAAAGRS